MKRPTLNIAKSGIGGAIVVGGLLTGATLALAQDDTANTTPTEQAPDTTVEETPSPDDTFIPPWGDGEAPWVDGEAPWGDGETPWAGGFGAGGFGGFGAGFAGAGLDDLAADLGMTPEELMAAFNAGQTLPEIAEAAGVDLEGLFGGAGRFANGEGAPWGDGPPPWAVEAEEN